MSNRIVINNLNQIHAAAQQFINLMGSQRVFAFYGSMGVGKTTFVRAICQELDVKDTVSSPTFAIVNEYHTTDGEPIYHFDFYRIHKLQEAYDIGCQEYFDSGQLCFIEWPELIEDLLPPDAVKVMLCEEKDGARVMEF